MRDSDLIFILAGRLVAFSVVIAALLWLLDAGGCL